MKSSCCTYVQKVNRFKWNVCSLQYSQHLDGSVHSLKRDNWSTGVAWQTSSKTDSACAIKDNLDSGNQWHNRWWWVASHIHLVTIDESNSCLTPLRRPSNRQNIIRRQSFSELLHAEGFLFPSWVNCSTLREKECEKNIWPNKQKSRYLQWNRKSRRWWKTRSQYFHRRLSSLK